MQSFGDKTITFSTTNVFSDFVKRYDGKCFVSTVEVPFIGNEIDIQKNLTQDEKKNIYDQTSATRKEDTTEKRTEVETSVLKVPMPHQVLQMLKKFDFKTHLSRQIPDIQVTITDDGIELIGSTERRLNDEIKAFMSKIGFKSIETLPPSVLKVYDTCDIVKQTIDARLEKTKIICHWYIDLNENSLKVFTPDRESLFTAECEISNTVTYKEYPNTDCTKELVLKLGLFLKNGMNSD